MKPDTAEAIVRALGEIPGPPTSSCRIPVFDPLGNIMAYTNGMQCVICQRITKGFKEEHNLSCAYIHALRHLKAKKRGKG